MVDLRKMNPYMPNTSEYLDQSQREMDFAKIYDDFIQNYDNFRKEEVAAENNR